MISIWLKVITNSIKKMEEQSLEKIHIDLPNHWAIGGESLWVTPLGDNLYKLENIPFYAYGLNYHDIVRAVSDSSEDKPEIQELVKKSEHRTFRIYFEKAIGRERQEEILDSMKDLTVSYERANQIYFSLDVKPEGNYDAVFDKLVEFEQNGILGFETCEARVEGSFDALPEAKD